MTFSLYSLGGTMGGGHGVKVSEGHMTARCHKVKEDDVPMSVG